MKLRELEKILNENGYSLERQNKHFIYKKGSHSIPVPRHPNKDLNRMLVQRIMKQIEGHKTSIRQL